uniref:Uncharacterized protein n=1 Tax=Proboscia inermis TaxID=420281 RepID=A0A7S0GJH9_9STRA|mmetsp:Transcript_41751/g.42363  ORF Transcript_41751/g.42363 Transcript_41751/m.42363 type:complete len:127 (+) Transcript_41751:311-691(+)
MGTALCRPLHEPRNVAIVATIVTPLPATNLRSKLVTSSSMSSEVGSFSYETTSNVNQPSAEGKSTFNRPSNITGTAPSVSGLAQPDTQPTNISGSLQKNSKNNMSQITSPTTNITTRHLTKQTWTE